jgi:hypothetical protein
MEQVGRQRHNEAAIDDQSYSAKIKQSLSTGQNRLRRNKGAPADIMAIRTSNITTATDSA